MLAEKHTFSLQERGIKVVILAVLIGIGIFLMIFKLWQTSLKDLGASPMLAAVISVIVVLLFIVACYMD